MTRGAPPRQGRRGSGRAPTLLLLDGAVDAHTPSAAEQDYLKQIYRLQEETRRATTQELATRLGVKPSSVTAMLKHLAEHPAGPYVRHMPRRGVELTDKGLAVALEMVRRHRLIELFLTEILDMPWDQVHAEAERLEHVLSEELEERIAAKLGQPTRDPHGDPIPRRDGTMEDVDGQLLSALPVGVRATVRRVQDGDPALLRYLGTLGLVPGAEVTVDGVAPYGDVMTVRVGVTRHAVGAAVTRAVLVTPHATAGAAAGGAARAGLPESAPPDDPAGRVGLG
jgi:DtxR family Mn-dependent transcriptional regulator